MFETDHEDVKSLCHTVMFYISLLNAHTSQKLPRSTSTRLAEPGAGVQSLSGLDTANRHRSAAVFTAGNVPGGVKVGAWMACQL